jgi:large subunit ribosomal protein L6
MSRIGKMPIAIPKGVKVELSANEVKVSSSLGSLHHRLPEGISAKVDGDHLLLSRRDDTRQLSAVHGLTRSILNGMVSGCHKKFRKELQIVGVGYRAQIRGKNIINFNIGFSHPVDYMLPDGISGVVEANTKIVLEGCDKQLLGEVTAQIRKIKPPEPYKGKGIRYVDEHVRKKAGKAVAAAGSAGGAK